MKKFVLFIIMMFFVTGCSTIATKSLEQRVPKQAFEDDGRSIIYISDTQSVPTSLLEQHLSLLSLIATNQSDGVISKGSIPAEVIVGMANNAMQLAPQLNQQYIESTKAICTISREIYISGFEEDSESLDAIIEILKEWTEGTNQSILNNYK